MTTVEFDLEKDYFSMLTANRDLQVSLYALESSEGRGDCLDHIKTSLVISTFS